VFFGWEVVSEYDRLTERIEQARDMSLSSPNKDASRESQATREFSKQQNRLRRKLADLDAALASKQVGMKSYEEKNGINVHEITGRVRSQDAIRLE